MNNIKMTKKKAVHCTVLAHCAYALFCEMPKIRKNLALATRRSVCTHTHVHVSIETETNNLPCKNMFGKIVDRANHTAAIMRHISGQRKI